MIKLVPMSYLWTILTNRFWRMALPVGKTLDHPFANPFGPESPSLELVKLDPILLIVGGDEIMKDRVILYAEELKKLQKTIHYVEIEGKQHGFLTNEPYSDVSDSVFNLIKDFVFKHFG
ncbi:putative carboxylesterase [Helianthus debilis subsp. tardiflorus]